MPEGIFPFSRFPHGERPGWEGDPHATEAGGSPYKRVFNCQKPPCYPPKRILPKAWYLLHEAQARVLRATALGGKEVPDLNLMAGPQFDEWLANCRLPAQFQRDELRQAKDRTTHYQQAIYWIDLEEARAAQVALHNYLIENSIFMTNDLRLKFRAIDSALAKALSDHEIGVRRQSPDLIDTSSKILSHLSDLFAEVESAVQKRLRYDEA